MCFFGCASVHRKTIPKPTGDRSPILARRSSFEAVDLRTELLELRLRSAKACCLLGAAWIRTKAGWGSIQEGVKTSIQTVFIR